ncbi:MAG: alpha/beta hydrolase family protein [Chitinophagales bacterium]
MHHPLPNTRFILFSALLLILYSSCRHDLLQTEFDDSFRGEIISYELLHAYTIEQSDSAMAAYDPGLLTYPNDYPIEIYRVTYKTINAAGIETYATGAVVIPVNTTTPFPLTVYDHGTVTKRYDVPSYESGEILIGIAYACAGYVMSLPDYLGMGDSPGRHLYCHAKTEATATVDLLRATKTLCEEKNVLLNDQLFIFGYSQGGHAAMATAREIQLYHKDEFDVTACAPMSGPYDISGAQTDFVLSDEPYGAPFYLPYLMFAYNDVYKMYDSPSDFLIPPYDTVLPPLFDGTYDGWEIDLEMPSVPKLIIKPEVLDDFLLNIETNPFRIALKDNDLTGWQPNMPMIMYYCTADELVNYQNALNAQDFFIANGSTSTSLYQPSSTSNHTDCAQPCFIFARAWFDGMKD